MHCPSCEETLNVSFRHPKPRDLKCPHCAMALKFYLPPRIRFIWLCLAVFFLATTALFGFEGGLLLFSEIDFRVPSFLPLFILATGTFFLVSGAVFLILTENRCGGYVLYNDPRIGLTQALSEFPLGLLAVFLGVVLALPVFAIWGPNKHWTLSISAGCSGQETPVSRYNDLCQNVARAVFVAGANPSYGFPLNGTTPLSYAMAVKNLPMVYLLLDQDADVNEASVDGLPLLFQVLDDRTLFDAFIDQGARVDVKDNRGRTLLWHASAMGDLSLVNKLILLDSPVNTADTSHVTPLMVAATGDHLGVIEALIENGALIEFKNEQGLTTLARATLDGARPVAELLIQLGANVHLTFEGGLTLLHFTAISGDKFIADLLLKQGAKVDSLSLRDESPLTLAARHGNTAVGELLLSRGANVHHTDQAGWTALHWSAASTQAQPEMNELLLRYRANVHARGVAQDASGVIPLKKTPRDWTPLHLAARSGRPKTIHQLLEAGADPNALTGDHQTPLSIAVRSDGLEAVLLLLNRGAQPNFPGQTRTPLHIAAEKQVFDVAQALVSHGANVDAKNRKGHRPLDLILARMDEADRGPWLNVLAPASEK